MDAQEAFDEKILNRIPIEIVFLALLAAIAAWFIFDATTALLVLAGGILAALGFIWLQRSLTGLLQEDRKRAVRSAALMYGLRLLLIIGVFSIIILFFSKKVIAFAAGFSTIILVFLVEAIAALAKIKQWKN